MEVLDEDVQMVRDFLKGAPEFIKGHFENLVAEHEKEAAAVERLQDEIKALQEEQSDELSKAEERIEELEGEIEDRVDPRAALETVKYWMHDALILHKPMTDPRRILRLVEEACE